MLFAGQEVRIGSFSLYGPTKVIRIGYDIPMNLSHWCSGIILTAPLKYHISRSSDGKTQRLQFKDRNPPSLPLRSVFSVWAYRLPATLPISKCRR